MEESFDPYRKWLGIPEREQPPHLYRLLGIEPFESDPDVISTAADGRMVQIKQYQSGKHSRWSQQLLNEISAARVTLLNPEKKGRYDAELREQFEAARKPTVRAAAAAARPAAESSPAGAVGEDKSSAVAAIAEAAQAESPSVAAYVATHRKPRPRRVLPAALAGAGLLVLVVIVVAVAVHRGGGEPVAQVPAGPQPHVAGPRVDPGRTLPQDPPREGPTDPASGDTRTEDPGDGQAEPAEPDPSGEPSDPPGDDPDANPSEEPADPMALADLLDPSSDPPSEGPDSPDPQQGDPSAADAPDSRGRLAVPDAAATREAEQRIREVFGKELDAAKTAEQKKTLAESLFQHAQGTVENPALRYVMLRMACEAAAESGDLALCRRVAGWLDERYRVEWEAIWHYLLDKMLQSLPSTAEGIEGSKQVTAAARSAAESAAAGDRYDTADRFTRLALSAARRSRDATLVRDTTTYERELQRQRARFGTVQAALDTLAETPGDPEANLLAGRWFCFVQDRWEKGLPLLAKGADAELAALAASDLNSPSDATARMRLGDAWMAQAGKERGPEKATMESRAEHHYALALPGLTGLDKLRIEKQLAAVVVAGKPIRGAIQSGNVALAANGAKVSGVQNGPEFLLDGNSTHFGRSDRFAWSQAPCEWIITLDKVYQLQWIRFRLWDIAPERFFRYKLEISSDGEHFEPLVDRSEGQWRGWQEITVRPTPVRAIKLIGTYGHQYGTFCVVELEAYCAPAAAAGR